MRVALFVFVFLLKNVSAYILVTSRPVYMLVAPLMEGVDDIVLLANNQCCSHAYNIKFSDIQKVRDARLAVWMGSVHEPVFEPLMLKSQNVFTVFDQSSSFEWLSPKRMMTYVRLLSDQLVKTYPEKKELVRSNADKFLKVLGRLDATVAQTKISGLFITTYPFLDVFAQDYGLEVKFSLGKAPRYALSLSQKDKIKQNSCVRVLADKHLTQASENQITFLDTEGVGAPLSENAYKLFIEKLLGGIIYR